MIAAIVLGILFETSHMVGKFKIRLSTIAKKKRNKILIISYANHKPRSTKAAVKIKLILDLTLFLDEVPSIMSFVLSSLIILVPSFV